MEIKGAVALVTGANRGVGKAFAEALLAAGAAKVYAGARDPATIANPKLQAIRLDVTKQDEVLAAPKACADVNLLINNAGVLAFAPLIGASTLDAARAEMETNYFGMLAMCRAFAPVLKRNGGGALVNVLSTSSWINTGFMGSYAASKAAAWSATMGIRIELRAQGTLVVGVHFGNVDTDMIARVGGPKSRPADVVARVIEGIRAGHEEVLADARAVEVKAALTTDLRAMEATLQRIWDQRNSA